MKTPFHAQREAYNKAALCAAEAYILLGDTAVSGWTAHVLLSEVYDRIGQAVEALADIDKGLLGHDVKDMVKAIQQERGGVEP